VLDVIVVGAGPSGSYASHLLSKSGFSVLNLEEHKEVGKPVECTGLVSQRVFSMVKSGSRVNDVTGATVYFPGGGSIHVEKTEKTIVMDRDSFDKDVSAMAISSGADLKINARVIAVKKDSEGIDVTYRENGERKNARSHIIIGADGINSRVRKELFQERPGRIVSAYQVDSAHRMEDQDSVEVYLGSEYSSGFFGWTAPSGNITRIGVASYRSAAIKHFLRLNSRFPPNKIIGINGGSIPISHVKRTYSDNAILVGDAAGIVKPLSGGGIYTGMVSASHAARASIESLESEDHSSRFLSRYEKYWKSDIGMELAIDGIVQRYLFSMRDSALRNIYDILSKPSNISLINRLGDIDYPSRIVFAMLIRNPSLVGHLLLRR